MYFIDWMRTFVLKMLCYSPFKIISTIWRWFHSVLLFLQLELMSRTNFSAALLQCSEIKNSDWILQEMWLILTNQNARGAWIAEWYHTRLCSLPFALGCEFKPQWRQTLFRTQAQHLCFLHDSIWFIWFDTIICLSNLLCELWNRKLKIKEIYF